MPSHKKYTSFICRDCDIDFQVSRVGRKSIFCPLCGENLYTQKVRSLWIRRPVMHKRPWTVEEDDLIKAGIKAGYKVKKIAESFDARTLDAVRSRWERIKKAEEKLSGKN